MEVYRQQFGTQKGRATAFREAMLSVEKSLTAEQEPSCDDFGAMGGVLEGEVRDCELFRGIPVRFAGRIETVPVKGVSQSISIKAINNIAIVGTGGGVSLLDRGIHRFLRQYRYERIGLEMQLADDRFLLRGLERRGERELFLKGKYPFRIDVVNVQPGATVSFRTMLERLQNLDISAVRSER